MEKHTPIPIDEDAVRKVAELQDFIWEIIKNAVRLNNRLSEVEKRVKVYPETETN